MPTKLTCLRVFIASPGGLADERKAFRDEIQEFNDTDAIARGILFQPVGWEDTLGGIGRPQTIINEDVRRADYFVLLLWNRWGSPPDATSSRFTSGTEEEYCVAVDCCIRLKTMRQIVIMFKSVDPQQLSDPGQQLQKVLEFRKDMEEKKSHLFHGFDTTGSFSRLIHKHLAAWLRDEENGRAIENPPLFPVVEAGRREGAPGALQQELIEPIVSAELAKAWGLAEEGRLTEAEVEFAKNIVGQHSSQPLIEYGRFLHRLGRLDQAAAMFEGAVKVARDQGEQGAMASAYGNLGLMLEVRGDLDGAEQMHRKSLEINERLGRLEGMAGNYGNLGVMRRVRGDLDGAEQMHRKSLEINERLGHLEGIARAYDRLGVVLQVRGDLDGAEQMHHKSLEINERLGRLEGTARAYGNLGAVLQSRGDLDGAEQMHRKSLEINERLGHLEGMACDYGDLGLILQVRGDLDGAEQMHRKSLEINEQLGCLEGISVAYGNLGNVLQVRSDLDGAQQMHRKSLEINERLGHLEGMACNYGNLGGVLQVQGDLDGAEQMHRKSLEINERLGCLEGMVVAYGNLGIVLKVRGDLDGAELMLHKSLKTAEQLGSYHRVTDIKSLLNSLHKPPAKTDLNVE